MRGIFPFWIRSFYSLLYVFYIFKDFCIKVPVLKLPPGGVFSCSKKEQRREPQPEIEDFTPFWEAEEEEEVHNKTRIRREVESGEEDPLSMIYSKLHQTRHVIKRPE